MDGTHAAVGLEKNPACVKPSFQPGGNLAEILHNPPNNREAKTLA